MQEALQLLVLRTASFIATSAAVTCCAAAPVTTPFGLAEICRATISVVMGRDVRTIKSDQVLPDVVAVHYVRPDDKTRWDYRCKITGQRVLWASSTGRWRDHPMDEVLTYSASSTTLTIDQRFTDGSGSAKSFTTKDLNKP
jgi:hypothetical protein